MIECTLVEYCRINLAKPLITIIVLHLCDRYRKKIITPEFLSHTTSEEKRNLTHSYFIEIHHQGSDPCPSCHNMCVCANFHQLLRSMNSIVCFPALRFVYFLAEIRTHERAERRKIKIIFLCRKVCLPISNIVRSSQYVGNLS